MGSAQHLTEENIQPKLNKKSSRGKGDMERIRNSRLNSMPFSCDIGLESAWLSYGFY